MHPPSAVVIYLTVFLDLLGFGLILPQLQFFADRYGASPLQVGLLMSVFSLMQFLLAPAWGRLSDRMGRRPVLLVSIAGSTVSYLVFAFADSVTMLFVSRAMAGITAANLSAAQAYLTDITPPDQRTRAMGMIGAAFGVGFIFGPAMGGVLGQWGGVMAIGLGAALLSGANWLAALLLLPESLPPERRGLPRPMRLPLASLPEVLRMPGMGLLATVFFLNILAFSNLESTFVLLAARSYGLDTAEVGYVFAFIGVLGAIVQGGMVGRLGRRYGDRNILVVGCFLQVPSLAALPHMSEVQTLLPVLAVVAIGSGLTSPSLNALISRLAPADRRGEVFGVTQSLGSLGRILGPAWGGWTFGYLGKEAPYHTAALLLGVALALALLGSIEEAPEPAPS